ncbi:MAG TPA: hypothetical protein VGQ21_10475 [Thermoanaerobaculia bacterium]|nr:hypothetical protein [Thermoanaerobaculia bacterium]
MNAEAQRFGQLHAAVCDQPPDRFGNESVREIRAALEIIDDGLRKRLLSCRDGVEDSLLNFFNMRHSYLPWPRV